MSVEPESHERDAATNATKRYREAATDPVASRDVLQIGLAHAADEIDRLSLALREAERERDGASLESDERAEKWMEWQTRAEAAEAQVAALREALLEALTQVRVGDSNVHEHARLQAWHRSMVALLGTPDPGEFVMSDYWLRLAAPDPASARQSDSGGEG